MDVQYINPFIDAVMNCMETMVGITPDRKPPYVKTDKANQGDISGIIGFAAVNVSGSIALSFPKESALKIHNTLMGENVFEITTEVRDGIGELTNIVAGGAKSKLSEMGISFNISLPTIIVGREHEIHHKTDSPVIVVPFELRKHRFLMEVTMKTW